MGWNEKEVRKLKREYKEKTDEELADELGKTRGQVRGKRQRLGLKKSHATTWTDEEVSKLKQEYEEKTDEELADELGKTKGEIRGKRRRSGLEKSGSSLGGSHTNEGQIDSVTKSGRKTQINHSIGTGNKNFLKGKLGEMLADLMRSKVANFLEASLDERWEFFGWKIDVLNPDYEMIKFAEGGESQTNVVPRSRPPNVFSAPSEKEEDGTNAERQYVLANKDLLKKFHRVDPFTVDEKYYAVEYSGNTKEIEVNVSSSPNNDGREEERVNVELPVISDFRILAVEIKTTTSNVRDKLTEAQNRALDTAARSDHLEFYTMQIAINSENFSIPDSVDIELKRLN